MNYILEASREIPGAFQIISDLSRISGLDEVRSGWKKPNRDGNETIFTHTIKVGLGTFYATNGNIIQTHKALVHDAGEGKDAIDALPGEMTEQDKYNMEHNTMLWVKNNFKYGLYYYNLWEDYEKNKTSRDILIKDLDKVCPFIETLKYNNLEMQTEFKNEILEKVKNSRLLEIMLQVEDEHNFGEDPYMKYFTLLQQNAPFITIN